MSTRCCLASFCASLASLALVNFFSVASAPAAALPSCAACVSVAGVGVTMRGAYPWRSSARTAFQPETISRVAASGSSAPAMAETANQPAAFVPASMAMSAAVTPPPTTTGNSLAEQIVLICAASRVLPEPSLPPTEASGLVEETCRGPAPM